MKRILVLALALILVVGSMVVPSYAAELDPEGNVINVLDFATPNGQESYILYIGSAAGGYVPVSFDMPFRATYTYIDMVVRCASASISAEYLGNVREQLNVTQIARDGQAYLYRVYGQLRGNAVYDVNVDFNIGTATSLAFISCNVWMVSADSIADQGTIEVSWDVDEYSATQGSDGSPARVWFNGEANDNYQTDWVSGTIYCSNWRKYDYLEFFLYFDTDSITSISAFFDGRIVPSEISYLDSAGTGNGSSFMISVRLDLRGLDRTSSDNPTIFFEGNHSFGINTFSILNTTGFVVNEAGDSDTWWNLQFRKFFLDVSTKLIGIQQSITGLGNSVGSWFSTQFDKLDSIYQALIGTGDTDGFQNQVDQQGDKLDQMDEALNSVTKPALDRVDTNISGIVSDTDLANTAHVYTYIIDDNIMAPALTMVTILAMMSFALFGKR